jgi:hypothetical protein
MTKGQAAPLFPLLAQKLRQLGRYSPQASSDLCVLLQPLARLSFFPGEVALPNAQRRAAKMLGPSRLPRASQARGILRSVF